MIKRVPNTKDRFEVSMRMSFFVNADDKKKALDKFTNFCVRANMDASQEASEFLIPARNSERYRRVERLSF